MRGHTAGARRPRDEALPSRGRPFAPAQAVDPPTWPHGHSHRRGRRCRPHPALEPSADFSLGDTQGQRLCLQPGSWAFIEDLLCGGAATPGPPDMRKWSPLPCSSLGAPRTSYPCGPNSAQRGSPLAFGGPPERCSMPGAGEPTQGPAQRWRGWAGRASWRKRCLSEG